jgi:TonB family protein
MKTIKTGMKVIMLVGALLITTKLKANNDTTLVTVAHADTNDTTSTKSESGFILQEELAEFPGGENALNNYLAQNVHYPSMALLQGIQGKVTVSFVINENGEIENIQIVQSVGGNCDEEIIELVRNMPLWKPAVQAGHPIKTKQIIGFTFKL